MNKTIFMIQDIKPFIKRNLFNCENQCCHAYLAISSMSNIQRDGSQVHVLSAGNTFQGHQVH